jgi:hypothetical protein
MKKLATIAVLAAYALLAEEPKPLSAEKQEAISRKVIALQNEQIMYQRQQLELIETQRRIAAAASALDAEIEAARKASGASSDCNLTDKKEWQCKKP